MSKILLLTHRFPFPPNRGDKIRSHHMLRHLARNHAVSLGSLIDDERDLAHIDAVSELCEHVLTCRIDNVATRLRWLSGLLRGEAITTANFYVGRFQRELDALIRTTPFDAVICYSAPMAEYVFRSSCRAQLSAHATVITDLIDVDSVKWTDYTAAAKPPMSWVYRRESKKLAALETRVVRQCDKTLLTTRDEVVLLQSRFAEPCPIEVLANGVDLDFFSPDSDTTAPTGRPEGPAIVFTGVMDYAPNVDAVTWFADSVLPMIRAEIPAAHFVVVGSKPNAAVLALGEREHVTVTGFVDDVRDDLAAAAVCVAPLRIARGVQNKVLEAMAMQRPLVVTTAAATGIAAKAGRDMLIADDARAFADCVCRLIRDHALAECVAQSARRFVEANHRWESNMAVIDASLVTNDHFDAGSKRAGAVDNPVGVSA